MAAKLANMTMSDQWYLRSIDTIGYLQTNLQPYEWWIVNSSVFGDSRQVFIFFFPMLTALLNVLGAKVMWAAVFTEWSNHLLKWLFSGDRPYWWVQESDYFNDKNRPILRQFANTCESDPGTPSGHVAMNVAIFYIVTRGFSKFFIWNSRRYWCIKGLASTFLYTLYISWVGTIFVSRLYVQAHFIHQCTAGIFCGLIVGHLVWRSKYLLRMKHLGSYMCAVFLFASSSLAYMGLQRLGLNPNWSIPLATKHCFDSNYVRIDSQPILVILRDTATALGLGYGLSSKYRKGLNNPLMPTSFLRVILGAVCGVTLGKFFSYALEKTPTDDLVTFYSVSFGLHLIFPYLIVAVLPYLLHTLYPSKK